MSKIANFTTFAASTSATLALSGGPSGVSLPPLDPANSALVITSAASDVVWIMLAPNAAALGGAVPGPALRGSIVVAPGQAFLLTTANQGTAGYAAVFAKAGGGALTFQRGTAADVSSFTTRDDLILI